MTDIKIDSACLWITHLFMGIVFSQRPRMSSQDTIDAMIPSTKRSQESQSTIVILRLGFAHLMTMKSE